VGVAAPTPWLDVAGRPPDKLPDNRHAVPVWQGGHGGSMFLPLDRGIDWRDPPLATLGLALLCIAVFVGFQLDDADEAGAARDYYFGSGLAGIEIPAYQDWLRRQGRRGGLDGDARSGGESRHHWYLAIRQDSAFQQALERGDIIGPGDDDYAEWRHKRSEYEALLAEQTPMAWGLQPDRLDWANLVTHQFLHGGVMHLVGNLVFLVAVGLLVEAAAGALVTTLIYVVGGIGSGLSFAYLNPASVVPLIGASGSISALMGAMAVAYGWHSVRVFITLGFYIDYRRVPALVLLVPWFGLEWLKHQWYGDTSAVAYTAHMGGILAGALLMVPFRFMDGGMGERVEDASPSEAAIDDVLHRGAQALGRLDVEDAARDYEQVLSWRPGDKRALKGLYQSHRLRPASDAYHDVAHRIMGLEGAGASELVRETYHDYRQTARPKPRLPAEVLAALARRFLKEREIDEAERLLAVMARRPASFPRLREQISDLMRLQRELGHEERAARWAQTLERMSTE